MSKPRNQCQIPAAFDTRAFGRELAERVADYLVGQGKIAYEHRDYCGAGLFLRDGEFLYSEVQDGFPDPGPSRAIFADRATFVAWLAGQSDEALSGREAGNAFILGNQRITRARLEGVLVTHQMITALAGTAFAARYYQLGTRFPLGDRGHDGCGTEQEVLAILRSLGRVPTSHHWQIEPWPCPVFHFGWPVGAWAGSAQLYLVHLESLQFWCYFDRAEVRAGDCFAALARGAAEAGGLTVPDPSFREPVYRTVAELREVLAELFALQDLVSAVVAEQLA